MRGDRRRGAWLLSFAAACGGADRPAVPSAPICGDAGAHRILELSADEEVERIVATADDPGRVAFGIVAPPPASANRPASARDPVAIVVGDGCGEAFAVIEGARLVTASGVAPLACLGDALVPVEAPQSSPIPAAECRVQAVDGGIVVREPDTARLWLHARDGSAREVFDGVATAGELAARAWVADAERLVVRTDDGRVVEVKLADGAATELVDGVVDMVVAGGGRWLVVQARGDADTAETTGTGEIRRLDRQGDAAPVVLADARLADESAAVYGPWLVLRTAQGREVFGLSDGARLQLPAGTSFVRDLDDGRVWLHRDAAPYGERDELAWDPGTGATTEVYAGPGASRYAPDGLEVLVPSEAAGLQVGTLWLAPWDGRPHRRLGHDVGLSRRRLDDGRVLSVVQTQEDPPLGTLVLHDEAAGTRSEIADDVLTTSLRLEDAHPFAGDLLWVAADDDETRGLWRIRVPPQ